jgi:hypothetical protein
MKPYHKPEMRQVKSILMDLKGQTWYVNLEQFTISAETLRELDFYPCQVELP